MPQIRRVAARLEAASAAQLRVVVTHQPVAVTRAQDEKNLLHGRERAVQRWARAGADLILGGHIHLPYVLPLHDTFAGLPRRVWAVQAGTALSRRTRGDDRQFGERDSSRRASVRRRRAADARSSAGITRRRARRSSMVARHELALDGAKSAAARHAARMTSSAKPVAASCSRV